MQGAGFLGPSSLLNARGNEGGAPRREAQDLGPLDKGSGWRGSLGKGWWILSGGRLVVQKLKLCFSSSRAGACSGGFLSFLFSFKSNFSAQGDARWRWAQPSTE